MSNQARPDPLALPYYQYVAIGGEALFNAKIYVGTANTDPTNPANQIDVLAVQAGGGTTVLDQPIRTNAAGLAVNAVGDVVYPIVESEYSITVTDQNDVLKYEESCINPLDSAELGTKGNPFTFVDCFTFVNNIPYVDMFKDEDWIQVSGRTIENDGGYALYQVTDVPPTIRRNYENYIPLDVDGDGASLWAVLVDGFQRDFGEQAIEIIAHRSFRFIGIQNTAFNDGAALKHNIQSLETDIQITLDGIVVRFHDDTVDAETDGTGTIASLTLAQVQALTLTATVGTIYEDRIKIGTFDEFVKRAKEAGARIYPEIKNYRTIADIQLMVDVIEDNNYESMTIFQSFEIDDLVEVRQINKRVGVGWLTTNINSAQEFIDFDKLQKLKWADVLITQTIIVNFPFLVPLIYDAGIGIAAWALVNNTDIKQVLNVGVYRQMLDQPQLIASVRGIQNVNF